MSEIVTSFMWKSIKGPISPREMETSHLFFSVRMLWNNCCPVHLRIHPHKVWTIHFSNEYRKMAVQQLLLELSERPDVEEKFLQQLRYMNNNLKKVLE